MTVAHRTLRLVAGGLIVFLAGAASADAGWKKGVEKHAGLYADGEGTPTAIIMPDSGEERGICMIRFATGALRCLHGEDKKFSYGATVVPGGNVRGHVEFTGRGDATLHDSAEGNRTWRRVALAEVDLDFESDGLTLAGTLILPTGSGPHPAVVLTHGSGPATRQADAGMAMGYLFAAQGVAALVYDKRGFGRSQGEENSLHSFDDLARDAAAGATALRRRDDIDAGRVGLFGHSQGAWIAGLAASREPDTAFIIMEAGGGVTPGVQTAWWARQLLTQGTDLSSAEIDAALAFRDMKYRVFATGKNEEAYQAELERVRNTRWFPNVTERWPQPFWKTHHGFQPTDYLPRIACPVLVLLAEHDNYTPTEATRAVFEEVYRERDDISVHLIPDSNHAFLRTDTGLRLEDEMHELEGFSGVYFERLTDWLGAVVSLPTPSARAAGAT